MLHLIVVDWSVEEQCFTFLCFWLRKGCRSAIHILACVDDFLQSSQSINNPLADNQNSSPVEPPPPHPGELTSAYVHVCEWNKCVLQGYLKAQSTGLFTVFSSGPSNFTLWKGDFTQEGEKK